MALLGSFYSESINEKCLCQNVTDFASDFEIHTPSIFSSDANISYHSKHKFLEEKKTGVIVQNECEISLQTSLS